MRYRDITNHFCQLYQIGLVARSVRGMDIKNKDSAEALSCLVAGGGLEPPTSGL